MNRSMILFAVLLFCSALCSCGQGGSRYGKYNEYIIYEEYDNVWEYIVGYLYREDYPILVINADIHKTHIILGSCNIDGHFIDDTWYIWVRPVSDDEDNTFTELKFLFAASNKRYFDKQWEHKEFCERLYNGICSFMNDEWECGEEFDLSDYNGENH